MPPARVTTHKQVASLALRSSPAEVVQAPGQLRSALPTVHARPWCQDPHPGPLCEPSFWALERLDSAALLLPPSQLCLLRGQLPVQQGHRVRWRVGSQSRLQLAGGILLVLRLVVLRLGGGRAGGLQDQLGCQRAA